MIIFVNYCPIISHLASCEINAIRISRYNIRMTSIADEKRRYICVDIETAGPIPGEFAMLSIGACTIGSPRRTFYVELQPDRDGIDPQSMAVHHLDMQNLREEGRAPKAALEAFRDWLDMVLPEGQTPLFVAFNAPFDWMFVHDYFTRYLGENPFGHSALDIKALYMGYSGKPWAETSGKFLHRIYNEDKILSHNALQDAIDQAVILEGILADMEKGTVPP